MDEGLNNNSIGKTPISQRKTIKGICYGQFLIKYCVFNDKVPNRNDLNRFVTQILVISGSDTSSTGCKMLPLKLR